MSFFDDAEAGLGPKHNWEPGSLRAFCLEICALCLLADPDTVLDIGTGNGWSGISLAYALNLLGKPLSVLTTTGWDTRGWQLMLDSALPKRYGLELERVKTASGNFLDLDPGQLVEPGRIMVFYDMHDLPSKQWYLSERFLSEWVSRMDSGLVAVHDISKISPAYEIKTVRPDGYPMSRAEHWSGMHFAGFGETAVVVEWLNEHRGQIMPTHSSIKYFRVKGGKPL